MNYPKDLEVRELPLAEELQREAACSGREMLQGLALGVPLGGLIGAAVIWAVTSVWGAGL